MNTNILFKIMPKPVLRQLMGMLTKQIDDMSKNHKEANGMPVYIVAEKVVIRNEDGETEDSGVVYFCRNENGKLNPYRKYDKKYLESSKGSDTTMINQIAPMAMQMINRYEKENEGERIRFLIFNEEVPVLDKKGQFKKHEKRTFIQMVNDKGKSLTKMEFLDILNKV